MRNARMNEQHRAAHTRTRVSRISLATAMVAGLVLATGPVSSSTASPVGAFALFDIPEISSAPEDIAKGPDGNMWFTERAANRISRLTPAGVITEFAVPTGGSMPAGITLGPDGNMWFVEIFTDKIGRITPSGVITEFALPTPVSAPNDIAAGSDGNLWFTEDVGNKMAGLLLLVLSPSSHSLGQGLVRTTSP